MKGLERIAEVAIVGAIEVSVIVGLGLGLAALVKHVYCFIIAGCGG